MESINWTRSRIRQQHLIALGIPVNLDEILPYAGTKPLPIHHLSTRTGPSPPVVQSDSSRSEPTSRASSRPGTPRSNTPQQSLRAAGPVVAQLGLGPKPPLNEQRINALLAFDPGAPSCLRVGPSMYSVTCFVDELNLLPVSKLEQCLSELRLQTTNTSTLLTYLLQTRDALQQDSETYHQLIAELVSEAQKSKPGKRTGKRGGMSS